MILEKGQEHSVLMHLKAGELFRNQEYCEEYLEFLQKNKAESDIVYKYATLYSLETDFGNRTFSHPYSESAFEKLYDKWKQKGEVVENLKMYQMIWQDVRYFPVPEPVKNQRLSVGKYSADSSSSSEKAEYQFCDSWMAERTYGGKRRHEGTDLIPKKDVAGYYPVLSMTDGVVEKKGWLEKGGYRIGIRTQKGAYFYYAHLASYGDIRIGDSVRAGSLLGYMGDSGYGPEGTTGMFPVHLHVGIYVNLNGKEISVNPYWILRYLEQKKLKCLY